MNEERKQTDYPSKMNERERERERGRSKLDIFGKRYITVSKCLHPRNRKLARSARELRAVMTSCVPL